MPWPPLTGWQESTRKIHQSIHMVFDIAKKQHESSAKHDESVISTYSIVLVYNGYTSHKNGYIMLYMVISYLFWSHRTKMGQTSMSCTLKMPMFYWRNPHVFVGEISPYLLGPRTTKEAIHDRRLTTRTTWFHARFFWEIRPWLKSTKKRPNNKLGLVISSIKTFDSLGLESNYLIIVWKIHRFIIIHLYVCTVYIYVYIIIYIYIHICQCMYKFIFIFIFMAAEPGLDQISGRWKK